MGCLTRRSLLCLAMFGWTAGLTLAGPPAGDAKPLAHLEAYGDSITAGFLSDRTILSPPGLSTISQIMGELLMIELNGNKHEFQRFEARDDAWPAVLRAWLAEAARPVSMTNVAVSGGFVHELVEQVDRAGTTALPTAAFFWIGHNNLCNNPEAPERIGEYFAGWYRDALERWDRNHANSTAYLMPIGDVDRVYEALEGYVWYEGNSARFRCEDSWLRLFPYCRHNSRLFKQGKFKEYFLPRKEAIDKALGTLARQLTAASRSNRFVYLDGLLSNRYEPGFFSIDCYHLSKTGQVGVATDVYRRLGTELLGLVDGASPKKP